ncbi:hypothetical protein FGIG_00240, partial [Fasciola gigantica]
FSPSPPNNIAIADGEPVEIVDICEASVNSEYTLMLSDNLKDAMDFERKFIGETDRLASSDDTLPMTPFAGRHSGRRG